MKRKKRRLTGQAYKAVLIGKIKNKLEPILRASRIGVASVQPYWGRFVTHFGTLDKYNHGEPTDANNGVLRKWEETENHFLEKLLDRDWKPVNPKGPLELLADEAE